MRGRWEGERERGRDVQYGDEEEETDGEIWSGKG